MIRVVAVHTAMALVEPLTKIFKEYLPEVKLNHIADDSLIQEVIANDQVTPAYVVACWLIITLQPLRAPM